MINDLVEKYFAGAIWNSNTMTVYLVREKKIQRGSTWILGIRKNGENGKVIDNLQKLGRWLTLE